MENKANLPRLRAENAGSAKKQSQFLGARTFGMSLLEALAGTAIMGPAAEQGRLGSGKDMD